MNIVCLDLEGVLVPEIWIAFAEETGIPELKRTTRDEPDYDKLMNYRINILKEHGLGLKEIQETIAKIDPMPGAKEFLDELKENEFDIIVLDPPAFTKSRRTVQKAYNGYKRINKQAMKVLKNGGYLITCSCSRFMETANFEKMLREAASEAGVVLKQVSVTQQNADHPILWTMEETSYLKFYIFQII